MSEPKKLKSLPPLAVLHGCQQGCQETRSGQKTRKRLRLSYAPSSRATGLAVQQGHRRGEGKAKPLPRLLATSLQAPQLLTGKYNLAVQLSSTTQQYNLAVQLGPGLENLHNDMLFHYLKYTNYIGGNMDEFVGHSMPLFFCMGCKFTQSKKMRSYHPRLTAI